VVARPCRVARARFSTDRGGAWSNGLGLGAGIEYELTPDVALRAEYQVHHYADVFGSKPDIGQVTAGVKLAF
jgi:opacity protein-like surface antigen